MCFIQFDMESFAIEAKNYLDDMILFGQKLRVFYSTSETILPA